MARDIYRYNTNAAQWQRARTLWSSWLASAELEARSSPKGSSSHQTERHKHVRSYFYFTQSTTLTEWQVKSESRMTGRPEQQSLDFNLVPLVTALLPSGDKTGRKSCSFFQKIIEQTGRWLLRCPLLLEIGIRLLGKAVAACYWQIARLYALVEKPLLGYWYVQCRS